MSFFRVVRGGADEKSFRHNGSYGRDRNIVWPDMHSVRTDGERNVYAVVNEEQGPRRTSDREKRPPGGSQLASWCGFFTELNRGCTSGNRRLHDVEDCSRLRDIRVGDDDQPKTVTEISGRHVSDYDAPRVRYQAPSLARRELALAALCSANVAVKT